MPAPAFTPQQFRVAMAAVTALVHRGQYMTGPLATREAFGPLLVAMLVNAWFESRLGEWSTHGAANPQGGDGGQSWGPWQTHLRGAGKGHALDLLKDPVYNAHVILIETERRSAVLTPVLTGGTLGTFVSTWTAEVERPANRHQVGRERAALVDDWFGAGTAALPAWGLWAGALPAGVG